jgi:hypothetical protein
MVERQISSTCCHKVTDIATPSFGKETEELDLIQKLVITELGFRRILPFVKPNVNMKSKPIDS